VAATRPVRLARVQPRPVELISLAEAQQRLGVSNRTLRGWIAEGRIPAYRLGGKILRVRVDELEAFVAAGQLPTRSGLR
jgi:excisionase family DNA binding protein